MATVEECEQALRGLAASLAQKNATSRQSGFNRTLSCRVRDHDVVFAGRLHDGLLDDIRLATSTDAQIRLDLTSDDLLSMVEGTLNVSTAWATGRIKVGAGVRDILKLKSIF